MRRGCGDVFLASLEVHNAFRENSVDQRACAAQQLGGRFRCHVTVGVEDSLFAAACASRICFVKLVCGDLGELATSICHQRELDAEREMGERLELVVAGRDDALALFPAVAEERRIIADQDNHRDALSELGQDLFDEPRVGLMEADVDSSKRFVKRREIPRFGELALRVWIRKLHGGLTNR
jgi:hypothetical protein